MKSVWITIGGIAERFHNHIIPPDALGSPLNVFVNTTSRIIGTFPVVPNPKEEVIVYRIRHIKIDGDTT